MTSSDQNSLFSIFENTNSHTKCGVLTIFGLELKNVDFLPLSSPSPRKMRWSNIPCKMKINIVVTECFKVILIMFLLLPKTQSTYCAWNSVTLKVCQSTPSPVRTQKAQPNLQVTTQIRKVKNIISQLFNLCTLYF